MIAMWSLLLVLIGPQGYSQSVMYFPTKDQCEAGAKQIKAAMPLEWRHVCVPIEGRAK